MRLGELRVESQRLLRRGARFGGDLLNFFARNQTITHGEVPRCGGELRVGESVTRIESDRLFVVVDRSARILGRVAVVVEISTQKRVVGIDVLVRRRRSGSQLRGG